MTDQAFEEGGGDVTLERFRGVWRRLKAIEDTKPETMAAELKGLREDVGSLKRAFYTFSFSAVGAAIVFAFTVFAILGKH